MAQSANNRQLPNKEQALFRSLIRFYETKQYKKGIKQADAILKKYPEHGETLCMKGLTCSYLERKEEAYELVRKGLKFDFGSHVCWHVYGLLYRQDRDYMEAVKCYRHALRIDPENIQILRDLSLLQIHTRDLNGFAETRQRLLMTKSQNRMHWMGYCVALHLSESYDMARAVLDQYEKMFNDDKSMLPYDLSELHLYKAKIAEDACQLDESAKVLTDCESQIVDKLGLLEASARVAFGRGQPAEARPAVESLLNRIPENHGYALALLACQPEAAEWWPAPGKKTQEGRWERNAHSFPPTLSPDGSGHGVHGWLHKARFEQTARTTWHHLGKRHHACKVYPHQPTRPLTAAEQKWVCAFFDERAEKAGVAGKADVLTFLPLYFATGDLFKQRLDGYLQPRLRKGIPSLFRTLKPLYFLPGNAEIINTLLREYVQSLDPATAKCGFSSFDGRVEETPVTLTFVQLFYVQHLDVFGEWDQALKVLDAALADTPTLIELYTLKAKVLKHMGDLDAAAALLEEARAMDLQDRFLNTMAVRGMLRADQVDTAKKTVLLFPNPETAEESSLHDMQCMWYEYDLGSSYLRTKDNGLALKMFHETFSHFADIAEDQFDFHSYCFRKSTLRTYTCFLKMEDELYSHKFYRRAAKLGLQTYLSLLEAPVVEEAEKKEENLENMSAAERKRLKHKQKREQEKKEKESGGKDKDAKKDGKAPKKDEDPKGAKLLERAKMEEDALTVVHRLQKYCALDRTTQKFAFALHFRRGKLLLAAQALDRLYRLFQGDRLAPALSPLLLQFCLKGDLASADARVLPVVYRILSPMLGRELKSLADLKAGATAYADELASKVAGPKAEDMRYSELRHVLGALAHAGRAANVETIAKQLQPTILRPLKECRKLQAFLGKSLPGGSEGPLVLQFQDRVRAAYPRARYP